MRHLKRGRKLNRTPSHRRAMIRNMVTSLFLHGRITTTPAKAKEARPFAEKLITLAKEGTLHARRRAISLLHDKQIVASLFTEIAPRYASRPGGYTRILHLSKTRIGDSAPQALFELVEEEMTPKAKKSAPKAAVVEPAAEEAPAEEAPKAEDAADAPADEATEAPAEDATQDDASEEKPAE